MQNKKASPSEGEYVRVCVCMYPCVFLNSIKKNCSKEKNRNFECKVDITVIGLLYMCMCVCVNVCRGKTHCPCNTRVYTRHVFVHACICIQHFENAARALCSLALLLLLLLLVRLSASSKHLSISPRSISLPIARRSIFSLTILLETRFKEKIGTCLLGGDNRYR